MRLSRLITIAVATATIAFAGCSASSTSAIAPGAGPAGHARTTRFAFGHSTSVLPRALQARVANPVKSNPNLSHNSCPASGTLIYVSDAAFGLVNIYDSGLALCGQLSGFVEPQGITVHGGNLYVANTLGNPNGTGEIDEFHRGATSPFRKYTDPSGQYVVDVAVTGDGTVVGSNIFSPNTGIGSISTWHHGGRFVGNFVLPNMAESFFLDATDNGTLFSDGFDSINFATTFWTFTCPAGACTSGTELGQAMAFPGGVVDTQSGDILASDQLSSADTFEMPSLSPATFATTSGGDTVTLDEVGSPGDGPRPGGISQVYGADAVFNQTVCYQYKQNGSSPGGCGSVAGNSGGTALGVAIDSGS